MIQRIQTLYLLIVVALGCCTALLPVIDFRTVDTELEALYTLQYMNISGATESYAPVVAWLLFVVAAVIPLVALVTIFLYKKRSLQMSLTVANIIVMMGYYVLLTIAIWTIKDALTATWHMHVGVVFPLVNAILSYLALRGIAKDEALVRSLDRIR